jgi:FHS family L-fucose permease-like MFS transporter
MQNLMQHQTDAQKASNVYAIIMIGALFFIFGFITWLNSVLIPYLKIACELSNFQSYLVAFSFYIAYFVMAIPSGWALRKIGYKRGMALGLLIIAAGALVFIPAAASRLYSVFLMGLFIQGSGLALLQTASNPYITILGAPESAAKRISIMGICNKFAGALAPIILGAVALKNVDQLVNSLKAMTGEIRKSELDTLALRVITPYIIITSILIVLAALVYFSRLPEISSGEQTDETEGRSSTDRGVLQFPQVVLGVITLFLYVGVEVLAGDSVIAYASSEGIALVNAKFFTTYTLVAMVIGYIIGVICIPRVITQQKALVYSGWIGVFLSILILATGGYVSVLCLSLLGLANALVWPAIWPLALADLGKFTKPAASLLIMGIAGGALLPLLYGQLADVFSLKQAYVILIPCYCFIIYYAVAGSKLRPSKV